MSTGTETATATETKPARRSRARKPAIEIIESGPVDVVEITPAESETAPDPTQEPAQGSPEPPQGAISDGSDVESIDPTPENSATAQPEAFPSVAQEETKWPKHYVEALQDWEKRVHRAASACKSAEAEMAERKAALNTAKKAFDAAVAYLRTEADNKPEKLPLFDGQTPAAAPAPASVKASPPSGDAWKAWKLEDVEDLPGGTLDAFERVNLRTLGDLTLWLSRGNRLEDLLGIGPAKAEKIADKLAALHLAKPWEAVASAEPLEPEDDDDQVEPDDE